jgi:6-phosphogluconolactonase
MKTFTLLSFKAQTLLLCMAATPVPVSAGPAVFTSTNEAAGNAVVMYQRDNQGLLTLVDEFATGGTGTGMGLGNQGAIILSDDGEWLLVVNAASNNITVFQVERNGLLMTDLEPSGGELPVSLTIHDDLVYVLNAGGAGNITGFTLADGDLTPLPDSTRPLSGDPMPGPAQIEFSPDGSLLVVTEKNTNLIDTYEVGADGLATGGGPNVQMSAGMTPFGFAFTPQGFLIVSEAFGGAADASAVSSYSIDIDGNLTAVSASVPTTETAACWIAITNGGRFAYTTNTGSGTITGYAIKRPGGSLSILDADGITAETGPGTAPTDLALSNNSKFLFALNSATGEIVAFTVDKRTGSLTPLQSVGGLPVNATGLVAE